MKMNRKKWIWKQSCRCLSVILYLFSLLSWTSFPTVRAAAGNFSYAVEGSTAAGKTLTVSLILPEGSGDLAGFRAGLRFSSDQMECTSIRRNAAIPSSSLYSQIGSSEISCVYSAAGGTPVPLAGSILQFRFRMRSEAENTSSREIVLHLWADQAVNGSGEETEIPEYAEEIRLPAPDFAGGYLSSLVPDVGSLSPSFSPETLYYTLSVPASVKEIHFASACPDGSTVEVSRKTLQAAGKTTTIRIALTSPSGGKTVYTVCVYRSDSASLSNTADNTSAGNAESKFSSKGTGSLSDPSEIPYTPSSGVSDRPSLTVQQTQLPSALLILCFLFSAGAFLLVLLLFLRKRSEPKQSSRPHGQTKEAEKEGQNEENTENGPHS